ncbi:MAG: Adenylate cyclase [Candidatus Nomurabacteria bacterium GW2011_GWF2_43_8]|uniref:Adenylate cyclase n=3 Tax=Candidatus Nomuraibacteriota TaxID=1752729 RepID=A0A0G1HXE9_9BACT|nr:MAG: Adenylate cyclase [Candidatus Nomurabacteria bacterium GW2011_GWA2_43_15]KKT18826.1 MAG: Adenylate cyclase [Candidatus Nomurabacteria bacterium GW2011_GWB1_43_7]KKT24312.1 MAG: Adenylate cyclase [Candidatus Nomurabacteria bacterium GW2011_GWF2_43_8]
MQEEIETRFLEINKDELVKKLISLGAVDKGEEKLEEIIFHAADGSWVGKRKFVRLRKTKDKIKLTYKENVEQTASSAREIEFEISDLEKCSKFLEKIELKAMRRLEKYRHTLELGDVTVDVDTWPKIPTYVEIEGPSVESLKNFCNEFGLDWEKRFDGDAREVFRHYGFDLDKIDVITFSEFKQK